MKCLSELPRCTLSIHAHSARSLSEQGCVIIAHISREDVRKREVEYLRVELMIRSS